MCIRHNKTRRIIGENALLPKDTQTRPDISRMSLFLSDNNFWPIKSANKSNYTNVTEIGILCQSFLLYTP